jgi:formylglycine-generating enzyme required for sulfatase activity
MLATAFAAVALNATCLAQSPCDADLDHDGIVAGADLAIVLGDWGPCKGCRGDVTGNGTVDGIDLAFVLTLWGGACEPVPWGTVIEAAPDPAAVFDAELRSRIISTGLPWRVRHNATGIEMLLVPPGVFSMGCSQGSSNYGCLDQEQPVHTVTLTSAFYLGRYEVTQAQWQSGMGSNPSFFQGAYGSADSPIRPVERVSFDDVQAFVLLTNLRLPTEAEWEFGCRAGTTTPFHGALSFPHGSTSDAMLESIAWYECHGGCTTHAVGEKAANALGLHDMLGNVSEWCADWFGGYSSSAQSDPSGPATGLQRLHRGGSWNNGYGQTLVRSSNRFGYASNVRTWDVGFRVARNP